MTFALPEIRFWRKNALLAPFLCPVDHYLSTWFLSIESFFCFRSFFNFFNRQHAVCHNVLTSSGRVHPVAVIDHVFLVENLQYRVTKICPESDTVCLQKINAGDGLFKRSIRQIWFPPPSTADSSYNIDLPSSNCFCPKPVAPLLFSDVDDIFVRSDAEVMDVSVPVDFDRKNAQDTWVNLTTDFSSVNQIGTTIQEARREGEVYYNMYSESDKDLTAARASINKLTTEVHQLRASLQDLNISHNSLKNQSLDKLEEISSLRTRLRHGDNSHIKDVGKMLQTNLQSLPSYLCAASTPDDTLYQYLCFNPSPDTATKTHHASTLKCSLQPDKTGSSIDPKVVAGSRLIPFRQNLNDCWHHQLLEEFMTALGWPVCRSYSTVVCLAPCARLAMPMGFQLNKDVASILNHLCSSPAPQRLLWSLLFAFSPRRYLVRFQRKDARRKQPWMRGGSLTWREWI